MGFTCNKLCTTYANVREAGLPFFASNGPNTVTNLIVYLEWILSLVL